MKKLLWHFFTRLEPEVGDSNPRKPCKISDSITIDLLGLETSFLYFQNPSKVENLLNVKIFKYDVIDGSGGYKPLFYFTL